jgi:glucan phosphoethanolaminetransferase (alkaline phosphatase superfamily)
LLAAWLWLPTLCVLATDQVQDAMAAVALLLFSAGMLAFPLVFISRLRTYFLLCAPLALLVAPYCYLTLAYGSVPGDALVAATLHTGLAMSMQVVLSFGWLAAMAPLCVILYLMAALRVDRGWILSVPARKKLAALLLMAVLAAMVARQTLAHSVRLPPLLDQSTTSLAFPSGLASSLWRIWSRADGGAQFASVHGRAAGNDDGTLVVLVMGESVRSDHLGINGYARATTPRLAALGTELLSFRDVVSRANWTEAAVPGILARPLAQGRASLVHTYKEAGFDTAWLSNQEPFPFASGADVAEFATNTRDYHFRKDADLLPQFTSFIRQAGPRQFVVLHMAGSHIPYEERYDAPARKFVPTMRDLGIGAPRASDRAAVINSYDNTIVELDNFLARIITLLRAQSKPAVLIYTSDHGENLFDDDRALFMHAQRGPTRHDTHVPLLVWMNARYRAAHPQAVQGLLRNQARPISHADMFATVLDLGNVDWDGQDAHRSAASVLYREAPRNVKISLDAEVEAGQLR